MSTSIARIGHMYKLRGGSLRGFRAAIVTDGCLWAGVSDEALDQRYISPGFQCGRHEGSAQIVRADRWYSGLGGPPDNSLA